MRFVVFGGGMQGRVIAKDLLSRKEKPEVEIVDVNDIPQIPGVKFHKANVLNAIEANAIASSADALVLAVPSQIAEKALANLIEFGLPIADVSFTPTPPLHLHARAIETGSCCIVDCGTAPGLSHVLIGSAHTEFGGLDSISILVGGIPIKPPPIFQHAIYFNAADLIEEYVRPARGRLNGKEISPSPLEEPLDTYEHPEFGKLESFISDGLRSLLESFPKVPNMVERTLRWPGHIETMKTLKAIGVFDTEAAIDAIASAWSRKYRPDKYHDAILLIMEAEKAGKKRSWQLVDRYTDNQSAMSRVTGFTTAAIASLLARKKFTEPGVHAPERIGIDGLQDLVLADLAERGLNVTCKDSESSLTR
jgi:saccharopine dehydrogenase-like NADP-dependent oxidoreductase